MNGRWSEDEEELLKAFIEMGWDYQDICNELERNYRSICRKAFLLGISIFDQKRWSKEDVILLKDLINQGLMYPEIAIQINRSKDSIKAKTESLGLSSNNKSNNKLTNKDLDKRLEGKPIKRLEDYPKTCQDKIKCLCTICNNIWKISPSNLYKGRGCPNCAVYGFKLNVPAVTYCIYFKEFDLYKIGISNNHEIRFQNFGYTPEIIMLRQFDLGKDAEALEVQWLENIKDYKINTGKLKSGNTETFRYKD